MCSPKCPRCEGRDWQYKISPRGTLATRVVHALCLGCGYEETYLRRDSETELDDQHRIAAVTNRTRAA